jgi:lambda family phage portal protein
MIVRHAPGEMLPARVAPPTRLDRIVGWISPGRGLRRHIQRQMLSRAYAAALPGDGWRPKRAGASANTEHMASAAILRAKSRSLIENVDFVAAGMNARVSYAVGTGIVPTWRGRHGEALATLWAEWVKVAAAEDGRTYYGLQADAVRAMDSDGEVLIRIRPRRAADGLPVPMQLQLLEIEYLDVSRTQANGANTIINGIEYDQLGRVVSYWLWSAHPGDVGTAVRARGLQSSAVPASEIIHLRHPGRPGQGRGFPRLSPAITRTRDLQTLEDAELARKNLEARLSVLVSGDLNQMVSPEVQQQMGGAADARGSKNLGELASGGITELPPGMAEPTVVEPKAAPGFVDYCRYNIQLICAGGGFTYEQATGDWSGASWSSGRMRMLDFRREIEQLQWLTIVPTLCERVCQEFAAYAALGGSIVGKPSFTVEHSTPKWDYANPTQEVQADLAEVAGGMSSLSEKIRRRGYDPVKVFTELASDIKQLQTLGIWDALVMLLKGKDSGAGQAEPGAKPK